MRTPLDPSTLSAAAQRALGPGPARMMAARGLVPLPPVEQSAVLYQLALDADAMLSASAKATAANLPDKVITTAVADPSCDPRIVDFYAELAGLRPVVFDAIALDAKTADATIATLAERVGAREIDLIAQNEQRLLRHPEIIAAMYMNRHARMSTVDRVVELAVRNGVRVPGLAAWDEVARALTGEGARASSAADDAAFAAAAEQLTGDDAAITAGNAEQVISEADAEATIAKADEKGRQAPINTLGVPAKLRLAQMGNGFARATLIRDPLKIIAVAAIKSPGVSEIEASRYASNAGLHEEVIRHIAQKREWTKMYGIKVSLCRNPKTPVADVGRLLPFLREKDLENLMRSKGVASAVVAQARKLLMQRRGGSGK